MSQSETSWRIGAAPETVAPLSTSLDVLVGDYDNPLYGRLRAYREGEGLRWEIGSAHHGGAMMPLGHTSFLMALPPGLVPGWGTFVLDANGVPRELQTEVFGNYRRVEPAPDLHQEGSDRVWRSARP